jgi:hypothetical protein
MRTLLGGLLAVLCVASAGSAGDAVSQTFAAPVDRVWAVTEALLKQFGWDIEKADRSIGWIETESRRLEGEDYGVYAKGVQHRLRINVKAAGEGGTTVGVEREVFKRERILWMDKDEPVATADQSVEKKFLADIGKSL